MQENVNYYPEMIQNAIPWSSYSNAPPSENPAINEMRWEANNMVVELWNKLAGRVPMVIDGKAYLVRETPTIEPPMNDLGATRIIQVVRGFVNPVVSLSNISDDEAGLIYNHCMMNIISAMNENQEEYGVKSVAEMQIIISSIEPVLFCQIKRAVNGHESKNSRTQTLEQKTDSTNVNKTQGGFSLNPFK